MWWEATDEQSAILHSEVAALEARFRQHLESVERPSDQVAWGVGSAPDTGGTWNHPLILLSYEAVVVAGDNVPVGRYTSNDLFDRLGRGPARALLESWTNGLSMFVDVTTRPISASAQVVSGDLVREVAAAKRSATVGLPCLLAHTNTPAFLTAGHLVGGIGDRVEVMATGHGSSTWLRGEVVQWADPAGGTAGFDYAVVKLLDTGNQILGVAHGGPVGAPTPPYSPIDVVAYGALSGAKVGQVSGALTQIGDASRQWSSCWQIGPSYLLTLGDSGSLVLGTNGTCSGKVLGHFVGGSYWPHGPGLINQYVQDLDGCLMSGLDQHITI